MAKESGLEGKFGAQENKDQVSGWQICPDCDAIARIDRIDSSNCVYYLSCDGCGAEWDKDVS